MENESWNSLFYKWDQLVCPLLTRVKKSCISLSEQTWLGWQGNGIYVSHIGFGFITLNIEVKGKEDHPKMYQ